MKTELLSFPEDCGWLEAVLAIYRQNSKTLGFMPRGAFEDAMASSRLIALFDEDEIRGYLLFGRPAGKAVINHLCVAEILRGRGAARLLFESMRASLVDQDCSVIEVRTRRDIPAKTIWARLGFTNTGTLVGRGADSAIKEQWMFELPASEFERELLQSTLGSDGINAVFDANVLSKVTQQLDEIEEEEIKCLLAPTVSNNVRFYRTREALNELTRLKDDAEYFDRHRQLKSVPQAPSEPAKCAQELSKIRCIWGTFQSNQDESDAKHVAETSAAGVSYFVTMDGALLKKAPKIYEKVNVQVLRPVDLFTIIDEIERAGEYAATSIARTRIVERRPKSSEVGALNQSFRNPAFEKSRQFSATLRESLAAKPGTEVVVCEPGSQSPLALIICDNRGNSVHVRVARHKRSNIALAALARSIWAKLQRTSPQRIQRVVVEDVHISSSLQEKLHLMGFRYSQGALVKRSLPFVGHVSEFLEEHPDVRLDESQVDSAGALACLEQSLFPAKLMGSGIETVLTPIKPFWAANLFDEELASQELFSVEPHRLFRMQNVYYRSAKGLRPKAGSRLLWYVSSAKGTRCCAVRACSRLTRMTILPAEDAYSLHKKYGAYRWESILRMTKNEPKTKIMALEFTQTESFSNPVTLQQLRKLGLNAPQSPRRISDAQFESIYQAGVTRDG